MRRAQALVLAGALLVATERLPAESFVTFESGHVRPLALSPSGGLLFAVNTPDNRIEVFQTRDGSLVRRGETVVGLEPVAVAARTEQEVFVVNHLSDSVSVVDTSDPDHPFVRATLLVGDEPRDVVIGGSRRGKIFITAAGRGQNRPVHPGLTAPGTGRADVWVFDAGDLSAPPHILTLFCDSTRALAVSPDGRRVYAAAFLSGNRTTSINELATDPSRTSILGDGFVAPPLPPPDRDAAGVPAPHAGLIVQFDGDRWLDGAGQDWSPRVRFRLPDHDVFTIDAEADPPEVTGQASGAGTVLFNMAVNPADGKVYVSNIDSRNAVRFEPELRGHVVENRITILDGTAVHAVHLNPHIDYDIPDGTQEEIDASLALPAGMECSADGATLYVCALGSGKVGVLDVGGGVLGRIEVGGSPTGLALHEDARRLYVMERFLHAVFVVDLDSERLAEMVPLRYTSEPRRVREGRQYLYDARGSSAHGDVACGSCHIFGDIDGLAWDLGDPAADVEENPLAPVAPSADRPLAPFHPMKGPMTTQSFRGLAGAGAMHWRGDRNGGRAAPFDASEAFLAFRPAFQSLLGLGSEFASGEMEKLRDFALSLRYPPNPIAPLDGSLTPAQAAGKQLFLSSRSRTGPDGDGNACTDCHVLPLGTDGRALPLGAEGHAAASAQQSFKVPHLRNLYQKVGMFGYAVPNIASVTPARLGPVPTPFLGDQVRGFGFTHDGSVPAIFDLLLHPLESFSFPDEPGRPGSQKARELESFLLAFPTGLAPAVGQQVTMAAASLGAALRRLELLEARAGGGDGDLVIHGIYHRELRGWLLVRGAGGEAVYKSDRSAERFASEELRRAVADGGAVLTATLVPPGSGRRIGIDRDEDEALDQDELDLGFDPADPSSRPPHGEPRILRGDCNADAGVDISDALFTLRFLFLGGSVPPCKAACEGNEDGRLDISDGIIILRFLFQSGPAPGRYPECEVAAEVCGECPAP